MELSYSDTSTWKHHLDDVYLNFVTSKSNRSEYQTKFLFNLLGGDFNKLVQLESLMKSNHVCGCPDTMDEVNEILNS